MCVCGQVGGGGGGVGCWGGGGTGFFALITSLPIVHFRTSTFHCLALLLIHDNN